MRTDTPRWFAVAEALLLLWNLGGIDAFYSHYTMSLEVMAALPAGQAEVWTSMPGWLWVAYGVAV